MLALGRAPTEHHDGFLKGFIPPKTKQHSQVRHKHGSCAVLRKLEAGAVHQDALTSAWLMVWDQPALAQGSMDSAGSISAGTGSSISVLGAA